MPPVKSYISKALSDENAPTYTEPTVLAKLDITTIGCTSAKFGIIEFAAVVLNVRCGPAITSSPKPPFAAAPVPEVVAVIESINSIR